MRSVIIVLHLLLSAPLLAATITVNSSGTLSNPGAADDGQCTLFEAIDAANDNLPSGTQPGECIAGESGDVIDEIVFDIALLPATIVVEGELIISDGVSINGPHRDLLTLLGAGTSRILRFNNNAVSDDFALRDLTLSGGIAGVPDSIAGAGGAVWANHSQVELTIERVRFINNGALVQGGALSIAYGFNATTIIRDSIFDSNTSLGANDITDGGGGAIFIGGNHHVVIKDSTFVGNLAISPNDEFPGSDAGGGAILMLSSAVTAASTLQIYRSTFSANRAEGAGGAISFGGPVFPSDYTEAFIRHSTFTLNESDTDGDSSTGSGGALYSSTGSPVMLLNNVIARNEDQFGDVAPNLIGSFASQGHNFISNNSGIETVFPFGIPNSNNDFASSPFLDPGLADLADNGGPTPTHALLEGALPIDQGLCTLQIRDQRGAQDVINVTRRVDQPLIDDLADSCDIGAVEFGAEAAVLPVTIIDFHTLLEDEVLIANDVDGSLTPDLTSDDGVLADDTHPDGEPLIVTNAGSFEPVTISMSSGSLIDLSADGSFVYTPPANESGTAVATYRASDRRNRVSEQVSLTILPVNDAPGFVAASSAIEATSFDVPVSVPGWASQIDAGAPDESDQVLAFNFDVVEGNMALLAGAPTIDVISGDLVYEVVSGQAGYVLMDVTLTDDGGVDFGGVDVSEAASLTIGVDSTPPVVSVVSPPDGSVVEAGDMVTLSATATDAEDGDISSLVEWQSDINGVLGSGATLMVNALSTGVQRIRAQVVDSDKQPGRDFITLTIVASETPPEVVILSPEDDSEFGIGQPISFLASASDAEDGDISGELRWLSNIQGEIGAGAGFTLSSLVQGVHAITARAFDSDGLSDSDLIMIEVRPAPADVIFGDRFEGGASR